MNNIKKIFYKNKEILSYLFFGGLAFLVSIGTFALFNRLMMMNELIANIISWIITVFFAFVTNRKWVFTSAAEDIEKGFLVQMFRFYGGRIATLVIEEAILFVFITKIHFNSMAVKIIAQIVVIVLNYIISKVWVFKSKKRK